MRFAVDTGALVEALHVACRRVTLHAARRTPHTPTPHPHTPTLTPHLPQAIVGGSTEGGAFDRKCAEDPEYATAMARGLSRWCSWTGEPVPPPLDAWLARTSNDGHVTVT